MNEPTKAPPFDEVTLLHHRLCRAVGDPRRIQLLYALAEGPRSVGALAEALGVPQPTISRHLSTLRDSGVVETTRSGTTVIYQLAEPEIINVIEAMRAILRKVIARQSNTLEADSEAE